VDFKGKISIIIPCYNEQEIIGETYKRVSSVLQEAKLSSYEIVFINDGSNDSTFLILKGIAAVHENVKIINLSRNFGHQAALSAGIQNCIGDIAIIIDADLQDPPELFPELIETYQKENCNVVYCVRKNRKGESWFKKTSAKLFYKFIQQISDNPYPRDTGDFRLIDRNVIEEFKKLPEKNKFIRGLISWLGFKQVPFYFERENRKEGETKYSISKMLKFALNGITYFSNKPLFWSLKIGAFNLLFAILAIILLVIFPAQIGISQQLASGILITVFLLFTSLNFMILGILGIYLKNIFDELKDRPEYIIREIING
jgi:polyisoprenyl-phosphate glycosyltransferase